MASPLHTDPSSDAPQHPAQNTPDATLAALHALDEVRSHLSSWQVQAETQRQQLETSAAQALAQRDSAQSALQGLQVQHELLNTQFFHAQQQIEQLNLQQQNAQARIAQLDAEQRHAQSEIARLKHEHEMRCGELNAQLEERNDELQNRNAQLKARDELLQARNDELETRNGELRERDDQLQQRHAELRERDAQLLAQVERNKDLHLQLLEMYEDLRAEDLPTLILRIAMKLTNSEHGLFVQADGDDTIAQVGLDELPQFIQDALYEWTRRVAESNEPLVENDGSKLPDGSKLVNLAALPVTLQSTLKGVILVANKRNESYSEHDTELLLAIGRHAGLALENRRLHCELGQAFHSTIAVLADAIEAKDAYTRGHCDSVAQLAVEVGKRMDLNQEDLDRVRYAGLLHDIGKIGVPDGILLKPGRLLPEEFSMIQRHSNIGSDLVARVPSLNHIAPIVLHHHERVDGSGYPDGLVADNISLSSRIICVVDAFDAMTTPRPYREQIEPKEALIELKRCAGTHFDARVVDVVETVLQDNGQL